VKKIIDDGSTEKLWAPRNAGYFQRWNPFASFAKDTSDTNLKRDITQFCDSLTDQEFLSNIDTFLKDEPLIEPATRRAVESAYRTLSSTLTRLFGSIQQQLLRKCRDAATNQVQERIRAYQRDCQKRSADLFVQQINDAHIAEDDWCVYARLITSRLTHRHSKLPYRHFETFPGHCGTVPLPWYVLEFFVFYLYIML
jgi:hypothetical protein